MVVVLEWKEGSGFEGAGGKPVLASAVDGRTVKKIMRHIYEVKLEKSRLAKEYARNRFAPLIKRVQEEWGYAPLYMDLDDVPIDIMNGSRNTMLASYIIEKYLRYKRLGKRENIIITIVGMGGTAKTTYSVLSCMGAYMMMGLDESFALYNTMKSVFFNLDSFITGVKNVIRNNIWLPCLVADDIGEWLPKYWRDLRLFAFTEIFKLLEQAKDWAGVIVMTARSFEGSVTSSLRQKSDIIIEASEELLDNHSLYVYQWYQQKDWSKKESPSKLQRMMYIDAMPINVKMPREIWNNMMVSRRELAEKSLQILEEELPKRLKKIEESDGKK